MSDSPPGVDVAVVIPCWNHGRLLRAALASVTAQTVHPAQVIVVDDGSTDATVHVARTHPGVTLARQTHCGAAAARNVGVALADSEFIAFLDADDLWPPTSLAGRIAALRESGDDGCFGVVEEFRDPADEPRPVRPKSHARLSGSILVSSDSWARVGTFDPSLAAGEIIDWVARFDAAGLTWNVVDEVVLRRRIHDANTGRQTSTRRDLLEVARRSIAAKRNVS